MKPILSALLVATSLMTQPVSTAADATPLTLAVFDFDARNSGVADLGNQVSTLINVALSAEPNLVTVERAELAKILSEQELGLSGTVSADTAAKVGNLTGAKVLVTGRVFKVDKDVVLVAKIISSETSRVYGEMVKGAGTATDLASELAGKIAKTITGKSDTLVAKVETREERIAKLKSQLKEARRPTVFVRIPERHYGAPVNDPAAETEFMNLLRETGFTIVETESKAEVAISGEAFSAYGGRKGNLFICKARVEVKAADSKSGETMAADRETSVAVDLAEQTAGKTALQTAAEALAARLLPKLVK
jgi:hypothetical protein